MERVALIQKKTASTTGGEPPFPVLKLLLGPLGMEAWPKIWRGLHPGSKVLARAAPKDHTPNTLEASKLDMAAGWADPTVRRQGSSTSTAAAAGLLYQLPSESIGSGGFSQKLPHASSARVESRRV